MTKQQLLTFAAVLSAAALTACSGSEREAAPTQNIDAATVPSPATDPTPAPSAVSEIAPSADETPAASNSVAEAPPEEATAPDEQMMDDAAASGMTARATRDDPAGAQATPVEPVEKK